MPILWTVDVECLLVSPDKQDPEDDKDLDIEVEDEDEKEDEETEDEPNAVPVVPRRYVNAP